MLVGACIALFLSLNRSTSLLLGVLLLSLTFGAPALMLWAQQYKKFVLTFACGYIADCKAHSEVDSSKVSMAPCSCLSTRFEGHGMLQHQYWRPASQAFRVTNQVFSALCKQRNGHLSASGSVQTAKS